MSHDYHDAVDDEILDAIADRVLHPSESQQPGSVRDLAVHAIDQMLCTCVTDAEDACEGRYSAIHAALVEEVVHRVEAAAVRTRPAMVVGDSVDIASEQSFPASDAPAWIWRGRTARDTD